MATKSKSVVAQSEGDPALEGAEYTPEPVLTPPENVDPKLDSVKGIVNHHLASLPKDKFEAVLQDARDKWQAAQPKV